MQKKKDAVGRGKSTVIKRTEPAAFATVKSKDAGNIPQVLNGHVGAETIAEFLENPQNETLVLINIAIGQVHRTFKEYFLQHYMFIKALRESLPASGSECKIRVDDELYSWSQFCLKFYGVSSDYIRKLGIDYEEMLMFPVTPETEAAAAEAKAEKKEGKRKKKESVEEALHQNAQDRNRAITQAIELRLALGELIALIEKFKSSVPAELLNKARQEKLRILPPRVGMIVDDDDPPDRLPGMPIGEAGEANQAIN